MTSYVPPKKNAGFICYVSLVSQANTKIMQANPTLADGDFKVSIDGGALADLDTTPAVTPAASKMVKLTFSADEMNGDNIQLVASDAAGDEWCDLTLNIQTAAGTLDELSALASWARIMEGSYTAEEYMRLFAAVLLGKGSGLATTTAVYRDTGDTTDRVTATVDEFGNRSAVTLDPT